MHRLVIDGGAPLRGAIPASGSKNAALPLLFATLLAPGAHHLVRVPDLADTSATLSLLGRIGVPSLLDGDGVRLDTSRIAWCEAPKRIAAKTRASVLLLGPLLARCGEARIPRPGGCAIGSRPIDEHLRGLEALGCTFVVGDDEIHGVVSKLRGADIQLRVPTVTGTENLIMAAVRADGATRIANAAREPEVVALCEALVAMGARIRGAGTSIVEIVGVRELRPPDGPWEVIPDRIEVGTWLAAAAATAGEVLVERAAPADLGSSIEALRGLGCEVDVGVDWVRCRRVGPMRAIALSTAPWPGFPTDMQPVLTVLAALATGVSILEETLFEDRFRHADELARMGARIEQRGPQLWIDGVSRLVGGTVTATDLRAGAALLVAGLAADGTTHLLEPEHLDRGYAAFAEKVGALGGRVGRSSRPAELHHLQCVS